MNSLSETDSGANPFETPQPRRIRLTQGVLRVVVTLQCLGMATSRLHLHHADQFCEFLLQSRNVPAAQIASLSDLVAYGLVIGGVLTLLRPITLVLLLIAAYHGGTILATSVAETPFVHLDAAAQATQVITPVALLLVDFWPPRVKPTLVMCLAATTLLKFAIAISFIALGCLCLEQARLGGPLLEMMQEAVRKSGRELLARDAAHSLLIPLGVVEIGMAIALLTSRSRAAMAGCSLVGLLAAFLPTLGAGMNGYPESLRMVSLAGGPVAILIFHLTSVREQPPIYLPERRSAMRKPVIH